MEGQLFQDKILSYIIFRWLKCSALVGILFMNILSNSGTVQLPTQVKHLKTIDQKIYDHKIRSKLFHKLIRRENVSLKIADTVICIKTRTHGLLILMLYSLTRNSIGLYIGNAVQIVCIWN